MVARAACIERRQATGSRHADGRFEARTAASIGRGERPVACKRRGQLPNERSLEEIMKTKSITLALAIGGVTVAGVAGAQEKDHNVAAARSETLAPAANAIELSVGTGYAQGFGDIAANRPTLTDVAQPGGAVQL